MNPRLEQSTSKTTAHAHLPTSNNLSKSTPVLMPIPCNMYTTSSVGTLPEAPLAYGHPPSPATEESTIATPSSNDASMFGSAMA